MEVSSGLVTVQKRVEDFAAPNDYSDFAPSSLND